MFSTLYSKDRKGNLQQWQVSTDGAEVIVQYGLVGGKQAESRHTAYPKNVGRANATTAEEQAIKEAQSKWELQLKKGYAMDVAKIPASLLPLLASNYQKVSRRVKFPIPALIKKDGVRCSAYL